MDNEIVKTLMTRDGLTKTQATSLLQEGRDAIADGEDPEEVMADYFQLEPDYFLDLFPI